MILNKLIKNSQTFCFLLWMTGFVWGKAQQQNTAYCIKQRLNITVCNIMTECSLKVCEQTYLLN